MKIYTKTGDDGGTALFGGRRVRKDHLRIEAYGTVDELNAHIGLAVCAGPDAKTGELLSAIQHVLFVLGSDLATPLDETAVNVPRVQEPQVGWLERMIDELETALPPIRFFILPGGSEIAARLHVCRTICRRAERAVVALAAAEHISDTNIRYLNRLSDFLFVLSRFANQAAGGEEIRWQQP